jgi:hypothetical protein
MRLVVSSKHLGMFLPLRFAFPAGFYLRFLRQVIVRDGDTPANIKRSFHRMNTIRRVGHVIPREFNAAAKHLIGYLNSVRGGIEYIRFA